jgi:hypothetical protein
MSIRDDIVDARLISNGRPAGARMKMNAELLVRIQTKFREETGFEPFSVSETLYYFFHEIQSIPLCRCGNRPKYIDFTHGYHAHCSSKCAALNPESQRKLKQTNLERYGVENPLKSSDIQQRIKETNTVRYGAENPMQNVIVREKAASTNLQRYGGASPLQNSAVMQKSVITSQDRYGVSHPMKSNIFQDKQRQTNLERLGVEYPTQSDEVRLKSKETNLERYGFENPMQNLDVIRRAQTTCFERYGTKTSNQQHYSEFTREILFDSLLFSEFAQNKSLNTIGQLLQIDPSTVGDYCRKYGVPISGSTYEDEIYDFLTKLGLEVKIRSRSVISPQEVDFYIEEINLAIEFNGLYYHSFDFMRTQPRNSSKTNRILMNYHHDKYLACRDRGIRLLMINEDEWVERSDLVKSKILNICGKSEKGVGARSLRITKITGALANSFCDRHHLQGKTGTVISAYGAYSNDELVAVILFNRQRGTGKTELVRFCTDGKSYAGAFSKLLKHAIHNEEYDELVSFADVRYSDGGLYEKNGFVLDGNIPPDYRYFKGLKTFHKSTFTKNAIKKKFGIDISGKTEIDLMTDLGYHRIYDCGKIRYIWRKP